MAKLPITCSIFLILLAISGQYSPSALVIGLRVMHVIQMSMYLLSNHVHDRITQPRSIIANADMTDRGFLALPFPSFTCTVVQASLGRRGCPKGCAKPHAPPRLPSPPPPSTPLPSPFPPPPPPVKHIGGKLRYRFLNHQSLRVIIQKIEAVLPLK